MIGVMSVGKDFTGTMFTSKTVTQPYSPKSSVSTTEAPQSSDSSATDILESPQRTERPLGALLGRGFRPAGAKRELHHRNATLRWSASESLRQMLKRDG